MAKFTWLLMPALSFCVACGPGRPPAEQPESLFSEAKKAIKSEPKVQALRVSETDAWKVSVKDDGTNRNGYASYLCEVLRENKAVVDGTRVIITAPNGIVLGSMNCNSYKPV